jgi:hypothetical protein
MVGTLWRGRSGILVCTRYEDGFLYLTYLDNPKYCSCAHESSIHTHFTQLTQPQEET